MNSKKAEKTTSSEYLKQFEHRFKAFAGKVSHSALGHRKTLYTTFFESEYSAYRGDISEAVLVCDNALEVVSDHTAWMDAWIGFTWRFVYAEKKALMQELLKESDKKRAFLEKSIPDKRRKMKELKSYLDSDAVEQLLMDASERSYYKNSLADLERDLETSEKELAVLSATAPLIHSTDVSENNLLKGIVVFARGGFGREELTFTSDIDLGYCLDPESLDLLEQQTARELIKRMEELFQSLELDIASQYFELKEDLSRFGHQDALHAVPSILEGRTLIGNPLHLESLKHQILIMCPQEKIIRYLKRQMDDLRLESNEVFYIKEGYGGVRHIQYALWMVLIVVNHESGNSSDLFRFLRRNDWISRLDETRLNQALELYLDLRNFIGLFDLYKDRLIAMGSESLVQRHSKEINFLDDQSCMAFLKLKNRFTTVDYLDRFRLYSIHTVARLAQTIVDNILDRTITEKRSGFLIFKHLGSNQITHLQPLEDEPSADRDESDAVEFYNPASTSKGPLEDLFLHLPNLMELFRYIGESGNRLNPRLMEVLSSLVPDLEKPVQSFDREQIRSFLFDVFITENASVAIQQMIEIASPLDRKGNIHTTLGLFLPEVNKMRYLLRNTEIHEFPLCVHSLKALGQVEEEIGDIQKNEPQLWRFISRNDLFALKWSVFFHDVGKINPYRNHEALGPVVSTKMLLRLGWDEESDTLDLIRLLIEHHQSVVRFSRLSTYLDQGILKFFGLAQRDPIKVLLLYLVNISDYKSVNSEMRHRAGHLERFFEKTISILSTFKGEQSSGSMHDIINTYLNRMVTEVRTSVLLKLLLNQCCNQSLEDTILIPLRRLSVQAAREVETHQEELEDALVYLKLAELDHKTLEKYSFRFIQLIRQAIPESLILELVRPLSSQWNWFFTAVPNRYLLSSEVTAITAQVQQFEARQHRNPRFSYNKGEQGEYDTILFHGIGDIEIQAKIAYALSWRGTNIENGKINKVIYADGQEGWVGFFSVSQISGEDMLSNIELESVIENLTIPPLNPPPVSERVESQIQVQYFNEPEKGYLVCESDSGSFSREKTNFVAVKISLFDAPFCYYKIMRSFEAIGVLPQQVTITTIGNQVIDYFYIRPQEKQKLVKNGFKSLLQKYVNAKIHIE